MTIPDGHEYLPAIPGAYRKAGGHRTKKQVEAEALAALDMKRQGYIDSQIAERLGMSLATVARRVEQALALFGEPTAAQYRALVAQQYDSLYQQLVPDIAAGDHDAIGKATAILDRKAKLLGLEAPQQIELAVQVETIQDATLRNLLRQAEEEAAQREARIVDGEVVE